MTTYNNPRYVAYCRAHGKPPEEMQKHDRERWPGGFMAGYMLWIQEKLHEFKTQSPRSFTCDGLTDHKGFDEFLSRTIQAKPEGGNNEGLILDRQWGEELKRIGRGY